MTFQQIINKVLIRLREKTIANSTDNEYSALIGEFVNETKREVEDAHAWTSLRTTVTVATVQGTTQYALTGAGKRFKVLDVYETTTKSPLPKGNAIHMKAEIVEASQAQPHAYFMEGIDSNGDLQVNMAQVPDAVYSYNFHLKVPQVALVDDAVATMDEWLLILGAYSKALEERGEDGGKGASQAAEAFRTAVSDAIAIDMGLTQDEDTWYV